MKKIYLLCLLIMQTGAGCLMAQNVGISANGTPPNTNAMLDISSTSSGLLIPRMTTVQRDAIAGPTVGLQVYNLDTNTVDIFRGVNWESTTGFTSLTSSVVNVNSLADLPAPSGTAINLVPGKMYSFSRLVDIGVNYINLNGASMRGNNPVSDGVKSAVSGAILRSTDQNIFLQGLLVVLNNNATTAYDFSDATGTKSCNLISGNNVKQETVVNNSAGVGRFSGFRAVIILQNYFDVGDGLKVTGTMGRLILGFNLFGGIAAGKSAVEMLPSLTVKDVDLSNNHFIFNAATATGIKVSGATVDRGRMSTNMFRDVATPIFGFSGGTPGWQMQNNTGVPNTRAHAFLAMNSNSMPTTFNSTSTTAFPTAYTPIVGNTVLVRQEKFTAANNQITYTGKSPVSVRVTAIVGGKAPYAGADYSIVIIKGGLVIPFPAASIGTMLNNQAFQIVLETDVLLETGDYLEVGIRNDTSTASVTISDLQLRVSE